MQIGWENLNIWKLSMADLPYILSAEDIAAMPGLEKTHFLNPNAVRLNKSLGDATGLSGFGIHLIDVAPGRDTTEHHVHHFEDECVYVLEGTGTAYIEDDAHPIGPGDFIGYRKGGASHSITNTGAGPLRMLVVGERLPHDVGDYTRLGKRIHRHAGQDWELVDHADITTLGGAVGKKDP